MVNEERKKQIIEGIENLVFHRFAKEELREELTDILAIEIDDLDNHYINGKEYSDNEIYDDFYSIDIEICKGTDAYINIYFLNTNEDNIIFISEVSVDINNWE